MRKQISPNEFYGETVMPKSFDWEIRRERANRLFLKPIFAFSNPMTQIFSVQKSVKTKARMYYLDRPSKILQKNDDCEFRPMGKMTLTQRDIEVERVKVNMQQCNDEFFNTCLEDALGDELDIFDPNKSEHIQKLKGAMLVNIQQAIIDDTLRLALFGDESLADPFYGLTDGAIKAIETAVTASEITQIATGSGAPLAAGASVTIFESAHANSHITLRKLKKNQKSYLVSESIYENYRKYLQALGTELANTYIINGVPMGLMYNGIPVIEVPEIDQILTEDFGLTDPHRIIYQANGVLRVATDMIGKSAFLRIYLDPVHRKKWYYDSAFKIGADFVHPELITYGK